MSSAMPGHDSDEETTRRKSVEKVVDRRRLVPCSRRQRWRSEPRNVAAEVRKREEKTPACVRIFICGAHSTGKTTLIRSILNDEMISGRHGRRDAEGEKEEAAEEELLCAQTEVARTVIPQMCSRRDLFVDFVNFPRAFEFVQHEISREQNRIEEMNDYQHKNYLYDRGIDPVVYAWKYVGDESRNRLLATDFIQKSIKRYRESIVFVTTPSERCVTEDGFRMDPTFKDLSDYTEHMKLLLQELRIAFHLIEATDLETRKEFVLNIIKPILGPTN